MQSSAPTAIAVPVASKLPALDAVLALVLLRVTLGALFVWTFFENLGKEL